MYLNTARYELIKQVKQMINIPLIANGDIDSPEKTKYVLDYTGADAIMIGQAAQEDRGFSGNRALFKNRRTFGCT